MLELTEQIILIVLLLIGNWDVIHRVLPWLQLRSSLINYACIGVAPPRLFTLQIFTFFTFMLCVNFTLIIIDHHFIYLRQLSQTRSMSECMLFFCFLIFCMFLYGKHFLRKMLGMDANTVIEKILWPRLIETAYNDLFTLC